MRRNLSEINETLTTTSSLKGLCHRFEQIIEQPKFISVSKEIKVISSFRCSKIMCSMG